jgi:O-acetyl-ADP-ribose deacetylase
MRSELSRAVKSNMPTVAKETFMEGRVIVLVGDLTKQAVDAIVNAANSTLLGGGGVDGAIHNAGGPEILRECQRLRETILPGGLPTGEAVITSGGTLAARYVIHTVGPIYGRERSRESDLLAACYMNSLLIAADHSISSVAFPAISTGAFGYPKPEAAAVASGAIKEFLLEHQFPNEVRLVFFLEREARVFLQYQKF